MEAGGKEREQNVVVMRHGERIDHFEPMWPAHAEWPWDPPLTDDGKSWARNTGKSLRAIGFPIHRVLVSPFLRCLQTVAEAVSALCLVVDDDAIRTSQDAVNSSRVKEGDFRPPDFQIWQGRTPPGASQRPERLANLAVSSQEDAQATGIP